VTVHARPDREDGVRVLVGTGELDVAALPPVLPAVPALVAGASGVVLDLTAVTFFDSSGVRLVDALARACAGTGAPFRVVAPHRVLARRVLEIVGMVDGLVEDDLEAAVTAVRGVT
jgi:anti-anti-sigma factor